MNPVLEFTPRAPHAAGPVRAQREPGRAIAPRDPNPVLIRPVFQPIVHESRGRVSLHAYECLIRGGAGSPEETPAELFALFRRLGRETELDFACFAAGLAAIPGGSLGAGFHLNLLAQTAIGRCDELLAEIAAAAARGVRPSSLAVEIVEHGIGADPVRLITALDRLRRTGCLIAVDDAGEGEANLRLIIELKPDFVKIDRCFLPGIRASRAQQIAVCALRDVALAVGARVIAEGVERPEERDCLLELGISLFQGFYYCRPVEWRDLPASLRPHGA